MKKYRGLTFMEFLIVLFFVFSPVLISIIFINSGSEELYYIEKVHYKIDKKNMGIFLRQEKDKYIKLSNIEGFSEIKNIDVVVTKKENKINENLVFIMYNKADRYEYKNYKNELPQKVKGCLIVYNVKDESVVDTSAFLSDC
tara:strand:- start:110 stop:535 length:426 start_codon:yes stop_codon:yes gene_type:complete